MVARAANSLVDLIPTGCDPRFEAVLQANQEAAEVLQDRRAANEALEASIRVASRKIDDNTRFMGEVGMAAREGTRLALCELQDRQEKGMPLAELALWAAYLSDGDLSPPSERIARRQHAVAEYLSAPAETPVLFWGRTDQDRTLLQGGVFAGAALLRLFDGDRLVISAKIRRRTNSIDTLIQPVRELGTSESEPGCSAARVLLGHKAISAYIRTKVRGMVPVDASEKDMRSCITKLSELLAALGETRISLASTGVGKERRSRIKRSLHFDTAAAERMERIIAACFALEDAPPEAVAEELFEAFTRALLRPDGRNASLHDGLLTLKVGWVLMYLYGETSSDDVGSRVGAIRNEAAARLASRQKPTQAPIES